MSESGPPARVHLSVDRPVATVMVVAAVLVFGWISFERLPVSLMPELSYPTLTVRVDWPGAAPEEVEDAIARPVEELVRTVEGVTGVTSVSRAGSAEVVLRFRWGMDLDTAGQKARERIDLIDFPDGSQRPEILRWDPDLDPVLVIGLSGEMTATRLRALAEEELQRAIEGVRGVAMVRVRGGDEEVVRVALSETALQRSGLTIEQVEQRLISENVNVAGGRLADGERELLVRTISEFDSIDELAGMIVASGDGTTVRLRDVAEVERTWRPRRAIHRIGGREAVEIAVFKEADANLVAVAESVKRLLFGEVDGEGESVGEEERAGLAGGLPEGMTLHLVSDQSSYVRNALAEVSRAAVLGGLCAILVLFVFLGDPRSTVIVALAIPLSVIAAFVPMRFFGLTLNLMTLGGLALGIGMLVDNAIVVIEAIARRLEEGLGRREAAIEGASEVSGAVTASTLTTLAVFLPIAFLEGVAGQLFGELALTVVLALLASLVFALLFVPAMAALPAFEPAPTMGWRGKFSGWRSEAVLQVREDLAALLRRGRRRPAWLFLGVVLLPWLVVRTLLWLPVDVLRLFWLVVSGVLRLTVAGVHAGGGRVRGAWRRVSPVGPSGRLLSRTYTVMIRRTLLRPAWVLLLVLVAGWSMWKLWPMVGLQLLPELAQGELRVELQLPVGTPVDRTSAVTARVEERLAGHPDILRLSSFIGVSDDVVDRRERGEHMSDLTIRIHPGPELARAEERVLESVRRAVLIEPAVQFEVRRPALFSIESPVAINLHAQDQERLASATMRVAELARSEPLLREVRTSLAPGFPEVRIRFDRERMAALGLDVRSAAETVRRKVQGVKATELRLHDRSLDVELSIAAGAIGSVEALLDLPVGMVASVPAVLGAEGLLGGAAGGGDVAGGRAVPVLLRSVAEVEVARGPAEIRRIDGRRAAVVEARTTIMDVRSARESLTSAIESSGAAIGARWEVGGQSAELEAAMRGLLLALLIAVFLVYVVMASTFESFRGPLVILFSIPLALLGVLGALALTGHPLSIVAGIGVIVLAGIVVNNAIVLVDAAARFQREGLGALDATVRACEVRLRPVWITALTTMLGLVPMALGLGEGAELRQPLAWVVIAGLGAGTVLTLVVIPVLWLWSSGAWWAERDQVEADIEVPG